MRGIICILSKFLLISSFFVRSSSVFSYCTHNYCFITTNSTTGSNFTKPILSCKANNYSVYGAVNTERVHDEVAAFISQEPVSNFTFFLALNQQLAGVSTWYYFNGQNFSGDVDNQFGDRGLRYEYYAVVNKSSPTYEFSTSNPHKLLHYLCEFNSSKCQDFKESINSQKEINRSCYVKFENETLNWFEARNSCFKKGGDLAALPGNWTRNSYGNWLNDSKYYWFGIRWQNLHWVEPDSGSEMIYSRWLQGSPNNVNFQCVCMNSFGSWTDCNCNSSRPLICYKNNPMSAFSTTTFPTMATKFGSNSSEINNNKDSQNRNLVYGLGIGLGVGLFLLLIVIIIVTVVIIIIKKKRRLRDNGQGVKVSSKPQQPSKEAKQTDGKEIERQNLPDVAIYAEVLSVVKPSSEKVEGESEEPSGETIYAKPTFVPSPGAQNSNEHSSDGNRPTSVLLNSPQLSTDI